MRIFCSICKEIFIPYSEVLVTNCGHLYHNTCISTWTQQHKTCPQCRTKLSKPFRVYFDVEKDNAADPSTLEHELEKVSDKLREAERHKKNLLEENKNFEKIVEDMKECAVSLSKKNDILKTSVKALKEQVAKLSIKNQAVTQLESELKTWKAKVTTLERVDMLIKGSVEEVNKMIENTPLSELAVKQLCTYVGILKLHLRKLEDKNLRLSQENRDIAKKAYEDRMMHSKFKSLSEELKTLKVTNSKLESELYSLKALSEKQCPEKTKAPVLTGSEATQVKKAAKKHIFDIDLDYDYEDKTVKSNQPLQSTREIDHWEELVCAGPSRNFGLSINKSMSFNKTFIKCKENKDNNSRLEDAYAFDGFGGRKKLRLGGPTPLSEFEKIKKKNDRKTSTPVQHRKIIDYYQVD